MGLETGRVINDLVVTNPAATDLKSQGDDHIRLIKSALKTSFPGFTGTVAASGVSTGVTNSYLLTAAALAYTAGMLVSFSPVATNTGASVININGLGAVSILRIDGSVLSANDLVAGKYAEMVYDGSAFQLLSVSKSYVDNLSFTSSLPGQGGAAGKVITTDGTTASWTNTLTLAQLALTTALPIASGGTGGTTTATARSSLGAAAAGANSDITSLTGLTTALSVLQGGTGGTTAATARSSLGAAAVGANSDITSLTGLTTALSVLQGGTGGTTAATARSSLGAAAVGANSDITSLGALTTAIPSAATG